MQWLESMQLEMWILLSWLLSCNLFMFIPFLCSFCLLRIDLHTIPEVLNLGGWVDLLILPCMFKLRAFCSLFPTQFHLLLYPQPFRLSTPTVCYLSIFLSPHSSHFYSLTWTPNGLYPPSLLICPIIFLNIFINLQPIFIPQTISKLNFYTLSLLNSWTNLHPDACPTPLEDRVMINTGVYRHRHLSLLNRWLSHRFSLSLFVLGNSSLDSGLSFRMCN